MIVHLPPGTIHALGAGIVAVEFQTNADTTWRIWDWGRQPPRPLHLNEAVRDAAPDQRPQLLVPQPDRRLSPPRDRLIDERTYGGIPYVVERLEMTAPAAFATDGSRFEILLPLRGPVRVRSEAGIAEAPRGHAVFVPANSGDYVVTPESAVELLRFLPLLEPSGSVGGST